MNLLSMKETAEQLKVSISMLRAHLRFGNIHSTRFGRLHRFSDEEIARILNDGLPKLQPYKKKLTPEASKYLSDIGRVGGHATKGISTPKKRRASRINIKKALAAKHGGTLAVQPSEP